MYSTEYDVVDYKKMDQLDNLYELYLMRSNLYGHNAAFEVLGQIHRKYPDIKGTGNQVGTALEQKLLRGFKGLAAEISSNGLGSNGWIIVEPRNGSSLGELPEFCKVVQTEDSTPLWTMVWKNYPPGSIHCNQNIDNKVIANFFQNYPSAIFVYHPQPGEQIPREVFEKAVGISSFKSAVDSASLQRLDLPKLTPGDRFYYGVDPGSNEKIQAVVGTNGMQVSLIPESQVGNNVVQGVLLDIRVNKYSTLEMISPFVSKDPLSYSLPIQVVSQGSSLDEIPPRTIALDGVCLEPSFEDVYFKRLNLNASDTLHMPYSQSCSRLVFEALGKGFNPENCTILMTKVDPDSTFACWMLQNPHRVLEPETQKVLNTVDALKRFGSSFKYIDHDLAGQICQGVMADALLRQTSFLSRTDIAEHVVKQSVENFGRLINGHRFEIGNQLDPDYKIQQTQRDFVLAEGPSESLDSLFRRGYDKIFLYSNNPQGGFDYTLARRSNLVSDFPLMLSPGSVSNHPNFVDVIRKVESQRNGGVSWFNRHNSVYACGSSLTPTDVYSVLEEVVKANRQVVQKEIDFPSKGFRVS